jgi:hypothetical protein
MSTEKITIDTPVGEFVVARKVLLQYEYWQRMLAGSFAESGQDRVIWTIPAFPKSNPYLYQCLFQLLEDREYYILYTGQSLTSNEFRYLQMALDYLSELSLLQNLLLRAIQIICTLPNPYDHVHGLVRARMAFENVSEFDEFATEFRNACWRMFIDEETTGAVAFPFRDLRELFGKRLEHHGEFYEKYASPLHPECSLSVLVDLANPLDFLLSYAALPSYVRVPEFSVEIFRHSFLDISCEEATRRLTSLWQCTHYETPILKVLTSQFRCVVAGGAVLHALDKQSPGTGDIDIFVMGDAKEFQRVLDCFVEHESFCQLWHTKSTVTFRNQWGQKIQFIRTNHRSSEEIIGNFDMSYVMMYWSSKKGFRVHPYALEDMLSRETSLRTNYFLNKSERIAKAARKGFRVCGIPAGGIETRSQTQEFQKWECSDADRVCEFYSQEVRNYDFRVLTRTQRITYDRDLEVEKVTKSLFGIYCHKIRKYLSDSVLNRAHLSLTAAQKEHILDACKGSVHMKFSDLYDYDRYHFYKMVSDHRDHPLNYSGLSQVDIEYFYLGDGNNTVNVRVNLLCPMDTEKITISKFAYAFSEPLIIDGQVSPDVFCKWDQLFGGLHVQTPRNWTVHMQDQFSDLRLPWELAILTEIASDDELCDKFPEIDFRFFRIDMNMRAPPLSVQFLEFTRSMQEATDLLKARLPPELQLHGFFLTENIVAGYKDSEKYTCNVFELQENGEMVQISDSIYKYLFILKQNQKSPEP